MDGAARLRVPFMLSDRDHVRLPAARSRRSLPAVLLVLCCLTEPLLAQGARAQPFTRGRPLAEWVLQTEHYIPELRREAVKAIAALGPGAVSAVPALVRATRDENAEVRFWAVEGLRKIGPAAAKEGGAALAVVLGDDIRSNQQAARRALEAMGPAVLPVLLPSLESPDAWVRGNAAEAVGAVAGGKGAAVSALSRLLADDSLWVRASAAWAIGRIGPRAKSAAKPMTKALSEELRRDPTLAEVGQRLRVENLVYGLGRLGPAANDAVPLLLAVLYDGADSLRTTAAEALAGVGGKAAQPLGQAVRGPAPMPVRLGAARALRLMGPEGKKAVGDLVKLLETTDELEGGRELVIASADALGAMGKSARSALKVLEKQRKRSVTPDVVAALDRAIRKIRLGA